MKHVFTLLLLSIFISSCNAQGKRKNATTISIGDTVSTIDTALWIIFQDKNDVYWFGSDGQGVYRYDGKTIIHFSTKDGLCNNKIRDIKEDGPGNIFFSTLNGISKFDGQKFTTLPVANNLPFNNAWKSEPGDIWFKGNAEKNGVFRYDGKALYHLEFPKSPREDEFYKTHPRMSFSPYGIYTIYHDSKGNIWFGTAGMGICRFDGKSLSWLYEDHLTDVPGGGSFGIRSIIEDKEGKFWFCNTRYRYNIYPNHRQDDKRNNFINYKSEKGINIPKNQKEDGLIYYQYVVKDNNDALWMATYRDGIWKYDGKNITRYPVKDGSGINVISIYKDTYGGLWLGTQQSGVYRFNGKAFEKFRP